MSSPPFFSVVIPTKNRPELVKDAIWSVQRQSFADIEIVVLDNSDEEYSARNSLPTDDPRIRYVRTGGLTMPDNWERAYEEANGEYVCILSDRLVWSSAELLARVRQEILQSNTNVVTWSFADLVDGDISRRGSGICQRYSARDLIDVFAGMNWRRFSDVAPRGLNSTVHRGVLERVRARVGRVCPPLCPDYTSATMILLESGGVSHFDTMGLYSQGLRESNGLNARSTFQKCCDSVLALGAESVAHSFDLVPVKIATVTNMVVNDFLHVLGRWGAEVAFTDLNVSGYFELVWRDLLQFGPPDVHQDLYAEFGRAAKAFGVSEAYSNNLHPNAQGLNWGRRVGWKRLGQMLRRKSNVSGHVMSDSTDCLDIRAFVEAHEAEIFARSLGGTARQA
jgi:hypothetical protein